MVPGETRSVADHDAAQLSAVHTPTLMLHGARHTRPLVAG